MSESYLCGAFRLLCIALLQLVLISAIQYPHIGHTGRLSFIDVEFAVAAPPALTAQSAAPSALPARMPVALAPEVSVTATIPTKATSGRSCAAFVATGAVRVFHMLRRCVLGLVPSVAAPRVEPSPRAGGASAAAWLPGVTLVEATPHSAVAPAAAAAWMLGTVLPSAVAADGGSAGRGTRAERRAAPLPSDAATAHGSAGYVKWLQHMTDAAATGADISGGSFPLPLGSFTTMEMLQRGACLNCTGLMNRIALFAARAADEIASLRSSAAVRASAVGLTKDGAEEAKRVHDAALAILAVACDAVPGGSLAHAQCVDTLRRHGEPLRQRAVTAIRYALRGLTLSGETGSQPTLSLKEASSVPAIVSPMRFCAAECTPLFGADHRDEMQAATGLGHLLMPGGLVHVATAERGRADLRVIAVAPGFFSRIWWSVIVPVRRVTLLPMLTVNYFVSAFGDAVLAAMPPRFGHAVRAAEANGSAIVVWGLVVLLLLYALVGARDSYACRTLRSVQVTAHLASCLPGNVLAAILSPPAAAAAAPSTAWGVYDFRTGGASAATVAAVAAAAAAASAPARDGDDNTPRRETPDIAAAAAASSVAAPNLATIGLELGILTPLPFAAGGEANAAVTADLAYVATALRLVENEVLDDELRTQSHLLLPYCTQSGPAAPELPSPSAAGARAAAAPSAPGRAHTGSGTPSARSGSVTPRRGPPSAGLAVVRGATAAETPAASEREEAEGKPEKKATWGEFLCAFGYDALMFMNNAGNLSPFSARAASSAVAAYMAPRYSGDSDGTARSAAYRSGAWDRPSPSGLAHRHAAVGAAPAASGCGAPGPAGLDDAEYARWVAASATAAAHYRAQQKQQSAATAASAATNVQRRSRAN